LCYRPFYGEIDDLKLFDTLRNVDEIFDERFLVQTDDDKAQLLAEGITIILFLTFDFPVDLDLGNFGSGIVERMPRRLPSTTKIRSFGNSVQSFEIRPDDVNSDIELGLKCDDVVTKMAKTVINLEIKKISDGIMTTTILTVPSYGCLYDMMPDVPILLSAGLRLQQNLNSPNIRVMYVAEASKILSQLNNPTFFDSFTFKTGSSEAYESYNVVQLVQMPRPQLPNGLATLTLWMTERSTNVVQLPIVGYRTSEITGITLAARALSSSVPFQGSFARIDTFNATNVMGSALRPTASPEYIKYPLIINFAQTPSCDDQKDLGTLTYTATSDNFDAFKSSIHNKVPQLPVGSIYLKCHGVNDPPYVSIPNRVIEAEKNTAFRLEIEDVDSPLMFLALAKMPKKLAIYQTDDVASSSLGLVSLIPHSNIHVGWVVALSSTNNRKCYQNCQTHSIVGPLRFSENRTGFSVALEGTLQSSDVLEMTVAFEIEFYAKSFDIYAEIPEGISLTISTVKMIDGLEYYQRIWQGIPKPVAYSNNSFTFYGKQETAKKQLWNIDVCPSWVFTSSYKFEFDKPVGIQRVILSAIYAYAYDRPVAGAS
jgi:hypothetical protein